MSRIKDLQKQVIKVLADTDEPMKGIGAWRTDQDSLPARETEFCCLYRIEKR